MIQCDPPHHPSLPALESTGLGGREKEGERKRDRVGGIHFGIGHFGNNIEERYSEFRERKHAGFPRVPPQGTRKTL